MRMHDPVQLPSASTMGRILHEKLAYTYLVDASYERAIEEYELAVAMAREAHDLRGELKILGSVALCRAALGDVTSALDATRRVMELGRSRGLSRRRGNSGAQQRSDGVSSIQTIRGHLGSVHTTLGRPGVSIGVSVVREGRERQRVVRARDARRAEPHTVLLGDLVCPFVGTEHQLPRRHRPVAQRGGGIRAERAEHRHAPQRGDRLDPFHGDLTGPQVLEHEHGAHPFAAQDVRRLLKIVQVVLPALLVLAGHDSPGDVVAPELQG